MTVDTDVFEILPMRAMRKLKKDPVPRDMIDKILMLVLGHLVDKILNLGRSLLLRMKKVKSSLERYNYWLKERSGERLKKTATTREQKHRRCGAPCREYAHCASSSNGDGAQRLAI